MIFLTVISEEEVICKRRGHWYDDDEDWSKTILRHIFIFNPNNEPLLRLDSPNIDELSIKLKETESSYCDLCNEKLKYESQYGGNRRTFYSCQYVDEANTITLCKELNNQLDFLLYIPCLYINPCSISPAHRYIVSGYEKEYHFPYYLPIPSVRISGYNDCKMVEITINDFVKITQTSINNLQSKFILSSTKTFSEIRAEMVKDYRAGKYVPDPDEEEWYEFMLEKQKEEEDMLERGYTKEQVSLFQKYGVTDWEELKKQEND